MVEIDGSFGEGGGQMLRTALSLSAMLGSPFSIKNIRKNRKKPGLMPQHLAVVRALKAICKARVEGDAPGAMELLFMPDSVRPGNYRFDISTAGSACLLLQALLPPLIFARSSSTLFLSGGTHVPWSPPFHYLARVFIPAIRLLGVHTDVAIESYGFYPKGGGRIACRVHPVEKGSLPKGIDWVEPGQIEGIEGISGVGNLPLSIAERQRQAALQMLAQAGFRAEIETISVPGPGQGTFMFLNTSGKGCPAGFSSLGERGKKAEVVGGEAARAFVDHYSRKAVLDPHLADQILLYLAVLPGLSTFSTSCLTDHLLTNLTVIDRFLDIHYEMEGKVGSQGKVTLRATQSGPA